MTEEKEVRVWVDGCYDMVHFGHANALRQAKAKGDKLVVGIHSDAEIAKHKRPPVLTQEERCKLLQGIKWVDEVVKDAPYVTSLQLMDEYDCDFCVHGDDITTADGKDTYEEIKESGRYEEIPRTQGVSTTALIKRILTKFCEGPLELTPKSPYTGSNFLPTIQKFNQFYSPKSSEGCRVVFTAGVFDLFHVGHLDFLEKAKRLGDYLIIGVHSDTNSIMNIYERAMNVLACKFVDDVVFMEGSQKQVTEELMKHLKIDVVCHGKEGAEEELYKVPKEMKKFKIIDSENDMTTDKIIARVIENDSVYKKGISQKEAMEIEIEKNLMKDAVVAVVI